MDNGLSLLVLIAIVAGVFWLGFKLGYRYRDNLSLERQKKYRNTRAKIPVADVEPAAGQTGDQASG